jgi:hypothetical protein
MPRVRRTLAVAVAGALAAAALAGPAMAAGDDGSGTPEYRKAGEKPLEYLTSRSGGGDTAGFHASGEPTTDIIAVL